MARLQEEFHAKMRAAHYALNTERAYWNWIRRYIFFHDKQHPKDLGAPEISMFLIHLATKEYVAGSTQKQALSALVFLYEKVLFKEVEVDEWVRPRKTKTLPAAAAVFLIILLLVSKMELFDQYLEFRKNILCWLMFIW